MCGKMDLDHKINQVYTLCFYTFFNFNVEKKTFSMCYQSITVSVTVLFKTNLELDVCV